MGAECDGRELVQSLVLDGSENKGYVFAMGDLNYRINMAPEDVGAERTCDVVHGPHRGGRRQPEPRRLLRAAGQRPADPLSGNGGHLPRLPGAHAAELRTHVQEEGEDGERG